MLKWSPSHREKNGLRTPRPSVCQENWNSVNLNQTGQNLEVPEGNFEKNSAQSLFVKFGQSLEKTSDQNFRDDDNFEFLEEGIYEA